MKFKFKSDISDTELKARIENHNRNIKLQRKLYKYGFFGRKLCRLIVRTRDLFEGYYKE